MKIKLLFIGKLQADVFQEALMQYVKKINHYFSFEQIAIPYLKSSKTLSQEEQKVGGRADSKENLRTGLCRFTG